MHAHTWHRMLVRVAYMAPLLYSGQRGRQPCLSRSMLVQGVPYGDHTSCRGRWRGVGVAAQLKVGAAPDELILGARKLLDVVAQVHLRGSVALVRPLCST